MHPGRTCGSLDRNLSVRSHKRRYHRGYHPLSWSAPTVIAQIAFFPMQIVYVCSGQALRTSAFRELERLECSSKPLDFEASWYAEAPDGTRVHVPASW